MGPSLSDQDRRSAFLFFGSFVPAERANFNVQNVFLHDGGVVEMLGVRWGLWWGSQQRNDFDRLKDEVGKWMRAICSSYYLLTRTALRPLTEAWAEALDV